MFPFLEDSTLVRGRNTKCPRAISRSHCDKLIPSFRTTTRKLHSPQPRLFSMLTIEVSIAFVFHNGTGKRRSDLAAGCTAENFEENDIAGVALQHKINKMNWTYGLATRVKSDQITSLCRSFDPCGNGLTLWQHLAETGNLPGEADLPSRATKKHSLGLGRILVSLGHAEGEIRRWKTRIQKAIHPILRFIGGTRGEIVLNNSSRLFAMGDENQQVAGTVFGTFIFARMVQSRAFQRALLHDRRWLSVVRLIKSNTAPRKRFAFTWKEDKAPLKSRARVPHDLGNPAQDPWLLTNAYVMHDTGKWKDLNLKFVLTSWRDYVILMEKNRKFLDHVYPVVKLLINDALDCWDQDRDGMIENFGKAEQTHDAWQMEGASAYCGSLWLGALRVAEARAEECGDIESSIRYHQTLVKAKQVFIDKLWNGAYFNFCERSKSRDSVMADELCGIGFLQSCSPEMAAELVPTKKVSKALATIYELNVCKFGDGKMGAVSEMRPDGTLDRGENFNGDSTQLLAVMTRVLSASGYNFKLPRLSTRRNFYCAIGYMRPLSIWAMQWALERFDKFGKIDEHSSIQGLQPTTPAIPSPCPSEGYCSEERDESNQVLVDSGLSTSSGPG
ncbi:unnamed protein product, partial [Mesorhabditis belari]|uniref:Non-lysosomal glucosylceramidase n=1 Tax=Mesorhabditis belari TaxID=2138241 RepID=A0AAF3EI90_9BILA